MTIKILALFLSAVEPSLKLLPLVLDPFTKDLDCSGSGDENYSFSIIFPLNNSFKLQLPRQHRQIGRGTTYVTLHVIC
jgi:hypothetical protein